MLILGIDPGPLNSGWAIVCNDNGLLDVRDSGVLENEAMKRFIRQMLETHGKRRVKLAIESITSYGMAVGQETFDTCVWIGRFMETWPDPQDVMLIPRREVKGYICAGNPKATDSNIRHAIIELFPATGLSGDSKHARKSSVGTKAHPGPLYGVATHAWSALGVCLTCLHNMQPKAKPRVPTGVALIAEHEADDERRKKEPEFEPQPIPQTALTNAMAQDYVRAYPYVESDQGDNVQGM